MVVEECITPFQGLYLICLTAKDAKGREELVRWALPIVDVYYAVSGLYLICLTAKDAKGREELVRWALPIVDVLRCFSAIIGNFKV